MIEQELLVPHRWGIETDVIVAGSGRPGFPAATSAPLRAVAAYEPGEGGKIV
jgi:hypothetical protein